MLEAIDIIRHFNQICSESYSDKTEDQAFRENLIFVTLKFKPDQINGGSPKAAVELIEKLYARIARRAFGKRPGRKIHLQPIGYAFVDYDGTRQSGGQGGYSLLAGAPHIHLILMLMPNEGQKFYDLLISEKHDDIVEDILIEKFDPTKGTLAHLISYCKKGADALPTSFAGREDAWCILPPIKSKRLKSRRSQSDSGLV